MSRIAGKNSPRAAGESNRSVGAVCRTRLTFCVKLC